MPGWLARQGAIFEHRPVNVEELRQDACGIEEATHPLLSLAPHLPTLCRAARQDSPERVRVRAHPPFQGRHEAGLPIGHDAIGVGFVGYNDGQTARMGLERDVWQPFPQRG